MNYNERIAFCKHLYHKFTYSEVSPFKEFFGRGRSSFLAPGFEIIPYGIVQTAHNNNKKKNPA